jgi:hypothetical protein
MDRPVLVRRHLDRLHRRQVVRHDHTRDRPLRQRDPHRAIDQVPDLRRLHRHLHVLVRDVLEQRHEVDFLLVVAAERGPRLLSDDGDDRRVVELRVVQAVQQVDRAGSGRGQAHADLAGELRVAARHERRHLLVPDLDQLRVAVGAIEGAEEGVDAVARIAVDAVDTPFAEPREDVVRYELTHCRSPPCR